MPAAPRKNTSSAATAAIPPAAAITFSCPTATSTPGTATRCPPAKPPVPLPCRPDRLCRSALTITPRPRLPSQRFYNCTITRSGHCASMGTSDFFLNARGDQEKYLVSGNGSQSDQRRLLRSHAQRQSLRLGRLPVGQRNRRSRCRAEPVRPRRSRFLDPTGGPLRSHRFHDRTIARSASSLQGRRTTSSTRVGPMKNTLSAATTATRPAATTTSLMPNGNLYAWDGSLSTIPRQRPGSDAADHLLPGPGLFDGGDAPASHRRPCHDFRRYTDRK